MRYLIEPRIEYRIDRIYVKGYGFLSFAKITSKITTKITSKRAIQETAEATGDLTGNKIFWQNNK